jgi:endonuclease/exonuclease/phosphatase family metal-dependent hydrolase
MLSNLGRRLRRFRNRISRTNLLRSWLKLSPPSPESNEPGLIILQIDGLSRKEFDAALARKKLPFLKSMIDAGYFRRISFYSGLPSTTPAVQAEVMYGIPCAVPAFQFLHRESGRVFTMSENECVAGIVKERFSNAAPLLKGGASYSNLYSGGADATSCCVETASLLKIFTWTKVWKVIAVLPLYSWTLLRVAVLVGIELGISVMDAVYGLGAMRLTNGIREIQFVPARCVVSIVFREWLRIVTKLSIQRGVPIIYANFLGYDEQSHRRGPESRFAHWVLKGIDGVIQDIFRTGRRSTARRYEIVIFSDHGQEAVKLFQPESGKSIHEAVKDAIQNGPLATCAFVNLHEKHRASEFLRRRDSAFVPFWRKRLSTLQLSREELAESVVVTAMGPIGHVYFPTTLSDGSSSEYARALVERHQVPLVAYRDSNGQTMARTSEGLFAIPRDLHLICGKQHWFPKEMKADFLTLCNHPDAGDLLIFGWSATSAPLSFVEETGAHGGIGADETRGFALLPGKLNISPRKTAGGEYYIRGLDLYEAGRKFICQKSAAPRRFPREIVSNVDRVRVATYNVHACIGIDGHCDVHRIAQVLENSHADIIALQEIDVGRHRTDYQDQAQLIADQLEMHVEFFSVVQHGSGQYGLAVLSHLPMSRFFAEILTESNSKPFAESRGALGVIVETQAGPVRIINTHFGLDSKTRMMQVTKLLGHNWLGAETRLPTILCGDLNAGTSSPELRALRQAMRPVQDLVRGRNQGTFASVMPLRRIDHILVSRSIQVLETTVLKTAETRIASDHLPLIADLNVVPDISIVGNLVSAGAT